MDEEAKGAPGSSAPHQGHLLRRATTLREAQLEAAMEAAKVKCYRGMVMAASVATVNLSSLPPEEKKKPSHPAASSSKPTSAPSSPPPSVAGGMRGKLLLKKLQGAVLPRERVKKVVEMLWSDSRATAEQGCASLWLLAREAGPRSVVVDLCLQAGSSSSTKEGFLSKGLLPIVPRLHGLASATASISLRSWAVSAFWVLLEDKRFREQPYVFQQLRPLLVKLVCAYASVEESPKESGASTPHSAQSTSSSSPRSHSSSSSESESGSGSDSEGDSEDEEIARVAGLSAEEAVAARWKTADLRRHCERQRLAGVSLGALVHLVHYHRPSKEALQKEDVSRLPPP